MTICDICNEIDCCCNRVVTFTPDNYIRTITSSIIRSSEHCRSSHSEQDNRLITLRCVQHHRYNHTGLTAFETSNRAVWVLAILIWHKLIHHRNIIFTVYSEIVMNYVYRSLFYSDIFLMPSYTITHYTITDGGSP